MKRYGFAHAAAAQDAERFAGEDLKAYIFQHLVIAECLVNMLELNVRFLFRIRILRKVAHLS